MEDKKQKLGVTIMHLKGKYAYVSTTGSETSGFRFTQDQIKTLFGFLHYGAKEGMFENVEPKEFFDILGLNYLNLIRENPLESHKKFEDDYNQKVDELSIAVKNFEIEKRQIQPE